MSTTMKAPILLGEDYNDSLVTDRHTNFEALKTLFDITKKLILNQKHEIKHVSTIEWQFAPRCFRNIHDVKSGFGGLVKEQYAELRKGRLQLCCNQAWMKMVG